MSEKEAMYEVPGSRLETLRRLERGAAAVVAELCALAEEQPGNPHDPLSARLYEIAHKLELAMDVAAVSVGGGGEEK